MDYENLPDDYFLTAGAFTKKLYRDQYPAIDPTLPSLSQQGRVVVITGASSGLGAHGFPISFAKAGAKAIWLVARDKQGLKATRQRVVAVDPSIKVRAISLDVSDEVGVARVFDQIKSEDGKVDVLINNAGLSRGGPITSTAIDGIWKDFEVMVKGTFITSQYFTKLLGPTSRGYIINVSSIVAVLAMPGSDSYALSKMVQSAMQRYIALLNPNIIATSLHPGTVATNIVPEFFSRFAKDTHDLAAGTALWLASEDAQFMNGRYMSANWSVEEMVERREEIVEHDLLKFDLKIAPYAT
ncbi:hypothetical protein ANOM_007598 [Aspergillus nomiae NRRL 13137]|uniref:NAD(P)-binding protein n=1 Tax=Aspergillus nomiae NRRL (strain ATCC 15546 / NRRL 13137 / CBS 260.88 / M93) TaxID=1509407 RepID=A0A0L1IY67_ASPN3|nr:uncharacterized protein ANOM_007598 [Aspergillus nomiae NRRL 13137]KNG84429.1 hypothetical protein ANOM_007598 [Aspergillus nomiae NRRL 13137]